MKKKKVLIICIIIAILLIASAIGLVLYFQNQKDDEGAYREAEKKYDRLLVVSESINSEIDTKTAEAKEVLANNPNVGDSTAIDDLNSAIAELEGMKIQINSKSQKLKELNDSIEKMENGIKVFDETLLEKTSEEPVQIKINKDSDIDKAVNKVNTAVKNVKDAVKAEEDKKAEAAAKEAMEKMLSGDLTYASGTYKEVMYGSGSKLTIKADGSATITDSTGYTTDYKIKSVKKQNDGSYFGVTESVKNYAGEYVGDAGFKIYPVGVKAPFGNSNEIRIERIGGFSVDGGYQKN